jgi:uncharacterized protein YozE (UPF0346 family)
MRKASNYLVLVLVLVVCSLPSYGSAIASFYVMPKAKFEKFCTLTGLSRRREKVALIAVSKPGKVIYHDEQMKNPEYRKMQDHYDEVRRYLTENAKEPIKYNRSGWVLSEVIDFLKTKNIDLAEQSYASTGDFPWMLFDATTKSKYLEKLNPSKFNANDLNSAWDENQKNQQKFLVDYAKTKSSKKVFAKYFASMSKADEFPDRGKAMLECIDILHKYLKMVDDETVVLLHIG